RQARARALQASFATQSLIRAANGRGSSPAFGWIEQCGCALCASALYGTRSPRRRGYLPPAGRTSVGFSDPISENPNSLLAQVEVNDDSCRIGDQRGGQCR